MMILTNGTVLNEKFNFIDADIIIEDGKIKGITNENDYSNSDDSIDCSNCYILPGFIDTHIHGAYGIEFDDFKAKFDKALVFEAQNGVTTIAPTTQAASIETIINAVDNIVKEHDQDIRGAKIGGIHLEGPFVTQTFKGGLNPDFIKQPDEKVLVELIKHGKGLVKIITLAPELQGAEHVIKTAVKNNVKVSVGHSNATFDETTNAIEWGAMQATHIFNAMRPYNHREPGILGAILTNEKVKCEMICDFVHLNPVTIYLIYTMKTADNINIISDSNSFAGMDDEVYEINGRKHCSKNGVIRLEDGTIACSCMTMHQGVKNLVSIGIPLTEVSKMASLNPAKTLGIENETGSIAVGKCADLAVLGNDLNIKYTFVDGIRIL